MPDSPPRDHAIQCPHKWGDRRKRCICDDVRSDSLLYVGLGLLSLSLIGLACTVPFWFYN